MKYKWKNKHVSDNIRIIKKVLNSLGQLKWSESTLKSFFQSFPLVCLALLRFFIFLMSLVFSVQQNLMKMLLKLSTFLLTKDTKIDL